MIFYVNKKLKTNSKFFIQPNFTSLMNITSLISMIIISNFIAIVYDNKVDLFMIIWSFKFMYMIKTQILHTAFSI